MATPADSGTRYNDFALLDSGRRGPAGVGWHSEPHGAPADGPEEEAFSTSEADGGVGVDDTGSGKPAASAVVDAVPADPRHTDVVVEKAEERKDAGNTEDKNDDAVNDGSGLGLDDKPSDRTSDKSSDKSSDKPSDKTSDGRSRQHIESSRRPADPPSDHHRADSRYTRSDSSRRSRHKHHRRRDDGRRSREERGTGSSSHRHDRRSRTDPRHRSSRDHHDHHHRHHRRRNFSSSRSHHRDDHKHSRRRPDERLQLDPLPPGSVSPHPHHAYEETKAAYRDEPSSDCAREDTRRHYASHDNINDNNYNNNYNSTTAAYQTGSRDSQSHRRRRRDPERHRSAWGAASPRDQPGDAPNLDAPLGGVQGVGGQRRSRLQELRGGVMNLQAGFHVPLPPELTANMGAPSSNPANPRWPTTQQGIRGLSQTSGGLQPFQWAANVTPMRTVPPSHPTPQQQQHQQQQLPQQQHQWPAGTPSGLTHPPPYTPLYSQSQQMARDDPQTSATPLQTRAYAGGAGAGASTTVPSAGGEVTPSHTTPRTRTPAPAVNVPVNLKHSDCAPWDGVVDWDPLPARYATVLVRAPREYWDYENAKLVLAPQRRYSVVRRLDIGSGGNFVFLGRHSTSGDPCVLKTMRQRPCMAVQREVKLMCCLAGGPNIVGLFDVLNAQPDSPFTNTEAPGDSAFAAQHSSGSHWRRDRNFLSRQAVPESVGGLIRGSVLPKSQQQARVPVQDRDTLEPSQPRLLLDRRWQRAAVDVALVLELVPHIPYPALFGRMRLDLIRRYAFEALLALDWAHSRGIMHRDVKPQNLLVDLQEEEPAEAKSVQSAERKSEGDGDTPSRMCMTLRLVDWASGEFYHPRRNYSTAVGSRYFKAPEMLLGMTRYHYAVDMWSLGCVLAGLAFAKEPFLAGDSEAGQLRAIMRVCGSHAVMRCIQKYQIHVRTGTQPKDIARHNRRIILRAGSAQRTGRRQQRTSTSNTDPSNGAPGLFGILPNQHSLGLMFPESVFAARPYPRRALHSFVELGRNAHRCSPELLGLLDAMLTVDPQNRISARDALRHPFFKPLWKSLAKVRRLTGNLSEV